MKKYDLKHPFKSTTGADVKVVEIRRPKVRDVRNAARKAGGNAEEQGIVMLGDLCQLSPDDTDLLDLEDFVAIEKIIEGFLPGELRQNKPVAA